jgi:dynein heavy chain
MYLPVQDLIDSKTEKRRKGVYGPPSLKKYVIFVDDVNMPQREKYFAQPPIEILRQWMDHKGWYDRTPPCAFRTLVDIQFIGCMGPPGGGRNPVTMRFLRHFNFMSFTEMADASLFVIFTTILDATLKGGIIPEVQNCGSQIVKCTIDIYNTIRQELLPTPAKSHYTFNLRDLSKVIQGVLRGDISHCKDKNVIVSLWVHEAMRVFQVHHQLASFFSFQLNLYITHPISPPL